MAGIQVPQDQQAVTRDKFVFNKVWTHFFGDAARKINGVTLVETITTIDAIDAGTTQALVNELKAKVNEILEAIKA